MYVTSKRNSRVGRQDEKLAWDWEALTGSSKEEQVPNISRPKTSFFDRDRAIHTPRPLNRDGQKRASGGFSMPSAESQAKRIKVEHSSPEPFSFQTRGTPDARLVLEATETPAAPTKKPAGPFIIDDSDEESDTDTGPSAAPRPVTPPWQPALRNAMPASKLEQRAESKRLREEALARRFGRPGGPDRQRDAAKIEMPISPPPLQRAMPLSKAEPIDLTEDDPPAPAELSRSTKPVASSNEKKPSEVRSGPKPLTNDTRPTPAELPKTTRPVIPTVNNRTPEVRSISVPSTKPKASKAALRPPKSTTILRPQEVSPIPAAPKKDTTFKELREKLRQAELKREAEIKKQEATRPTALTRNGIADRRRAKQQEQRKRAAVEDAKKKAAAKQEAAEQTRQEAERRRQLEKDVEQTAVQQEKEYKKQLEEKNRIFMEKRKAEKNAQERLRQQQLEKQKAAERAEQQRLREERIRKQQEANVRLRDDENTETTSVEQQQATLPAPVLLLRVAKDVARDDDSAANAHDSSPSLQPRSLSSLCPGELRKLDRDRDRSHDRPLGWILPVDASVAAMRDGGSEWSTIRDFYALQTGLERSESTLRKRYRQVADALKEHNIPFQLLKRLRDGDGDARLEVNRRAHEQWPIPAEGPSPRPGSQAPSLRLNHRQPPATQTYNARSEALPKGDFTQYGNVNLNPVSRRDSATDGHQTMGGKTIDQNFFFHMLEQNHKAFVEMDEEHEGAPEVDRFYYTYGLKRRDLPVGSDPDDEDTYPATRCEGTYDSLEQANVAASQEIFRISSHQDGCPFPDFNQRIRLEQEVYEEGMLCYTLEMADGGMAQVVVDRALHAQRDVQYESDQPVATISRTVYYVKQKTTKREVVDEALSTEKEIVTESLLHNASHTDRDQANEIAINHFVHANYSYEGYPNLSKRTEVCKPRIETFRDSLLVGQLFHGIPDEVAHVEVWVEKGQVAGPRNL